MSSNADVNFGYTTRGRGNRRQRKNPPVTRGGSTFRMGELDPWEGRSDGSHEGRYNHALRAFEHDDFTRLPEHSIQRRVAEAVIYSFPTVTAATAGRIESAIRHVKFNLIKRSSANDNQAIQHGLTVARRALTETGAI